MVHPEKASYTLGEIVDQLGGQLIGEAGISIYKVATLANAQPGEISFLASGKYLSQLNATKASAVILNHQNRDSINIPRIIYDNPYAYFAKVSTLLNPSIPATPGIHSSAVIEATATIGKSAEIGAFVYIGKNAHIGEGSIIHPGCYIGDNVTIGKQCCVYPNVVVYHHCQMGDRVIIHSGAIIGADGFGIAEENQIWIKIPQIGRAVIGNDVEIGANTTIDRGAMDDTIIEQGVKLDNQIQIGHNVKVGAHTAIAGCVGIAGSTIIGKHCKIGGAATILGHLNIVDHVHISAGTLITKSIGHQGAYTAIYPFMPHKDWLKNAVQLKQLGHIAETIEMLEKRIVDLEREDK